jgi:class 3 adenylate cyclase/tetratricopeptide (TPR) repeat protein
LCAVVLTADPFAHRATENPRLPTPMARVLSRALEKSPERRYQSASDLQAALRRAASAPATAPPRALLPEQRQITLLACTAEVYARALDAVVPDDLDDLDGAAGERLRRWQVECARIAREHDGMVISQVGAQLLVCFGYPTVSDSASLLALQAAAAIRAQAEDPAREGGVAMAVRMGVATGLSIVEELRGLRGQGVPVIQGSPVQAASALAGLADRGEVLLSARTCELVRGWFACEPVLRPGALEVFRLGAALGVASRFEIATRRVLTPLHGRQAELAMQAELWRNATAGAGAALCLVGEAGLGKSRLVHALTRMAAAEAGTVMVAQCWPQRRRTPFHPVVALLRQSFGLEHATDAAAQREILDDALVGFSPAVHDEGALLAALLSVDGRESTGSPEQLRARTINSLSTLLFEMAAIHPLLLVIEDVHWSDPSTFEWLDHVIARIHDRRLLVVLTARPELTPRWSAAPCYHEHRLGALPEADARALAHDLATQLEVAPPLDLVDELVERSGGVPLYLEELLRFVLAVEAPARCSTRRQIPATLRDTLVASFDRLSAEARLVAQIGAVLERDFRGQLVEHLAGDAVVDVDSALSELEDAGVIVCKARRDDSQRLFRHALVQEAAYQSLAPAERRACHGRVADLLRSERSRGADMPVELLAAHYEAAGRVAEALDCWEEAGAAAFRKWALREAVEHLRRALVVLELLPADAARDRRELRLLLALGPPLTAVEGYAAAEVYTHAYELALRAGGSPPELLSPLAGQSELYVVGGNLSAARALGVRLLALASSAEDRTLTLLARRTLGITLLLQGELALATEHTRAGIALYTPAEHDRLVFPHDDPSAATVYLNNCMYLALSLWLRGAPREARAIAARARELANAISHRFGLAISCLFSALIENLCREFAHARDLAQYGLEITRAHQAKRWTAMAEQQLGWALAGQGQLGEGIAQMKRGITGWTNTGACSATTLFHVSLAEAEQRAGHIDDAAASLAAAEAMAARSGEHFYEPELVRVAVRVAHLRGRPPTELIPRLRGALAQATQQGAGSWTLRLASDLVELTRGTDLAPDGPALLECAITAIAGGDDTADVMRAKEIASMATARWMGT